MKKIVPITPGAISSTSVAKFMYTTVIIMYSRYAGAVGAAKFTRVPQERRSPSSAGARSDAFISPR